MPVVSAAAEPAFRTPNASFTPAALPHLGGNEDTLVCRVMIQPGPAGPEHRLTHHEVFVALDGRAVAYLDGERHPFGAGETLVVPPHTSFALECVDEQPFEALICAPAGLQVVTPGGTFPPPWSAAPGS